MVKLCEENPLDVHDIQENSTGIYVYPNPFSETFTVETNEMTKLISLEVLDATGKLVYADSDFGNEKNQKIINLTSLSQGVYVCRITGTTGVQITRLIKAD